VQNATLWRALLGVEKTVIESIEYDEDEQVLLAAVRPTRRALSRCGRCQRRSPSYDRGEGQRRWRALDLGTTQVWLEAEAPRVQCRIHGPTVAAVPWARHAAGHTRVFDEQVAWLATQCSKTAVTELMRVAWRTVGAIITRVWADVEASTDRFADLRRIGIDEISYKRGHKYLMVVVDHDSRRLGGPRRDATAPRCRSSSISSAPTGVPRSRTSALMEPASSTPSLLRWPAESRNAAPEDLGRGPRSGHTLAANASKR
jgi:transposase